MSYAKSVKKPSKGVANKGLHQAGFSWNFPKFPWLTDTLVFMLNGKGIKCSELCALHKKIKFSIKDSFGKCD